MLNAFIHSNMKLSVHTPTHRKEENRLLSYKQCLRCCHVLFMCSVSVTLLKVKSFITSLIKNNNRDNDYDDNQRRVLTRNNHHSSMFMNEHLAIPGYLQIYNVCNFPGGIISFFKFIIYLVLLKTNCMKKTLNCFECHSFFTFCTNLYNDTCTKATNKKLSQISSNAIRKTNCLYLPSIIFVLFSCLVSTGLCNSPPRFMLDNPNNDGSDIGGSGIVLRLREGGQQAGQPGIGTKIFHLKGIDNDGDALTFGVVSNPHGIVKVQNDPAGTNEANVLLARELDAEEKTQYEVVLSLTDGRLGLGNFITRSMLILVEDTNDNLPIFKQYPSTVSVKENTSPGTVVAILEATDADSGIFGQIKYRLATNEKDNEVFEIGTLQSVPKGAVVRLKQTLDYEIQSVYQLTVIAMDRGGFGGINGDGVNTAVASVLVKVEDVEDRKPEFIRVPSVTRVSEGVTKHTQVNIPSSLHSIHGKNAY